MKGRIIKGIAGFYYVYIPGHGTFECKARGNFRNKGLKPLVGDIVETDILEEEALTGNITDIYDRSNELIRPTVANVDQALIVFALKKPDPNLVILDRMMIQYAVRKVPAVICFNKEDLADEDYISSVLSDYSKSGCRVIFTSADTEAGIAELKEVLRGKLTVIAGPSGVGKSSLTNLLLGQEVSETGVISAKLKRGKHTTRHSEIFPLDEDTFIIDTPGFGCFDLLDIDASEISGYYNEFSVEGQCRFLPCSHTHEPECAVKEAVESGMIPRRRYESYVQIYNEQMNKRRY